jgi:hypothetical protein
MNKKQLELLKQIILSEIKDKLADHLTQWHGEWQHNDSSNCDALWTKLTDSFNPADNYNFIATTHICDVCGKYASASICDKCANSLNNRDWMLKNIDKSINEDYINSKLSYRAPAKLPHPCKVCGKYTSQEFIDVCDECKKGY